MTMTTCRECGKPISSTAAACPHCGHKPEKDKIGCAQVIKVGFLGIIITAIVVAIASGPSEPKKASSPADQQRFQEEVGALLYLKRNMKNPASFELVSFVRTPADTLCITYRGTNGFGAIVTQRYTVNNVVSSDSNEAWTSYCAGRDGKDVSKAKYALP